MATGTDDDSETLRFEDVDWDSYGGRDLRPSAPTASFLVLFGALVAFYCYDVFVLPSGEPTIWIVANSWTNDVIWDVTRVDWLSLFVGVLVVSFAVVPAVGEPAKVRKFRETYPKDPLSVVALVYVAGLALVGLVGPVLLDQPTLQFDQARQPPVYTSVASKYVTTCVGPVVDGHCQGTWATPLGTTMGGESILVWLVYGTRTALQFALISAVLMVPIATVVGTSAAYVGGRFDALVMRYVEVQDAVPTVIVYFLLVIFVGPTLFMLIVAYGLFNWSDMARLVRGEALSLKEEEFVSAARSAGAGPLTVVRRHLIPNLASTVVATLSMMVPKLILVEALFSFIGLSGDQSYSWGQLIQRGLIDGSLDGTTAVDLTGFEGLWWIPVLPALLISVTVLFFFVFGDALQTVVDPREG
ncbi:ABC transporter permease [Halobacteriales archaeon QS_8_69_26]|nr:MAG: ABC transporter permease [Halobacteriales archaeon QS_8_69_26]